MVLSKRPDSFSTKLKKQTPLSTINFIFPLPETIGQFVFQKKLPGHRKKIPRFKTEK